MPTPAGSATSFNSISLPRRCLLSSAPSKQPDQEILARPCLLRWRSRKDSNPHPVLRRHSTVHRREHRTVVIRTAVSSGAKLQRRLQPVKKRVRRCAATPKRDLALPFLGCLVTLPDDSNRNSDSRVLPYSTRRQRRASLSKQHPDLPRDLRRCSRGHPDAVRLVLSPTSTASHVLP